MDYTDDVRDATLLSGERDAVAGRASKPCKACGGSTASNATSYVYALGQIETRFPSVSVEKEFAQLLGRAETAGQTDKQAFHAALSKRENRYLVRQMCWVLTIRGLETYLLYPRDPLDFDQLVNAIRPQPNPADLDAVIGLRGPTAPPELCNGLTVPIVQFDQIYSFDRASLLKAAPKPAKYSTEAFTSAMEEVFDRIRQITDNTGASDEHRALNYMAMRYPAIFAMAAEEFSRDFSLTAVNVQPSALSGARRIVDAIFAYTNRNTDFTEKFFARVDVTEEFPFLVTKLSPYFDH